MTVLYAKSGAPVRGDRLPNTRRETAAGALIPFGSKCFTPFQVFPLRSEAGCDPQPQTPTPQIGKQGDPLGVDGEVDLGPVREDQPPSTRRGTAAGALIRRCRPSGGTCHPPAGLDSRALPTETKVEGGTSQSKSGTSVKLVIVEKGSNPHYHISGVGNSVQVCGLLKKRQDRRYASSLPSDR